jgi:Bacterial SH3 domain
MFLLPDATRTPLTTLPVGTLVQVLAKEGDWYRVIFHDPYFGGRTGYVQAATVRVNAPPSAPAPAPTPPVTTAPRQNATRSPARVAHRLTLAPWAERGDIWVNGMYQATSNAFTATTTLTRNVEPGSVTTSYGAGRPPVLDVGGRAIAARHLAVGAAVTWLSQSTDGAVSASIPHPFFFNAPRSVSGVAAGGPREELAVHGEVSGLVPIGRAAQLAVFGGPSYFQLKQGLVIDVKNTEAYPYDSATFISATTLNVTKSQIGFNAGVDLAARVSKHVGVGVIARYSRASVQLPASATENVTVRAGGLQVGGGVRFGF